MKFTKIWFYFAVAFLILWFIGASVLLFDSSEALLFYYTVYMLLGIAVLFFVRKDIFSPPGLFVIACFQAFGMNIPFFSVGYLNTQGASENVLFRGDASLGDATLSKILIILLVAEISFIIGYVLTLYKLLPLNKVLGTARPTRKVSIFSFIAILVVVVIAGAIRIYFHLGEAGVQPSIPMAGYVQYLLYNGVLILCFFFLTQGMRQGSAYTFLGLVPLLGVAVTQILLSWRGGIVYMVIVVFFLFWNNQILYKEKKMKALIWIVSLLVLVPSFIQLGNSIRAERLGGESNFAGSKGEFVFNILNRSQGSTRLAVVVNDIGPITFTNDFKLIELLEKGISTTRYIDEKLYGVRPGQSHSVGTSGPGGPYVAFGLLGVALAFFLLGVLYRSGYECMKGANKENVLGIVWYAITALLLFDILSENFNATTIKFVIAISAMMLVFSKAFFIQGRPARLPVN